MQFLIAAFDLACAYVRLAATAAGFQEKFSTAARTSTAAAAERKEKHAKSFRRKRPHMISEMCVKYGSSGVKGQRPLRFLGDPKGAILTLRMALFEIAAAGGCIGGHLWTGILYGTRCASRRSSHWAAAQREP